jgi:CheY-like chemotaxis protein
VQTALQASTSQILVVEDDEGLRFAMDWMLSDSGYAVVSAGNGVEALDVIASMLPRLILLDMRMPIMDGWEFARAYRSQPGPHAPIVVVTAAADARERALQINANGFLAKPFDVEDLIQVVQRHINS